MTPLKSTLFCALMVFASGASWSMDLAQCYQEALLQDSTLRAARAAAESGREVVPQARAQLLPNVSASLSGHSNRLSSTSPNGLGVSTTTDYNYYSHGETLTLRQPIYRKYLLDNYRQAGAVLRDVEATLAAEVQNLAVKVTAAYFDALLADEQHTLVKAQLTSYSTQLEAARKQFKVGAGTRTDIDDVQSRLDMTRALEFEARQNMQFTRSQLQVMINREVDTLAPLAAARLTLTPPQPESLEHWIERAELNSPEIKVLRARLDVAGLDIEKAKAGHTPTLDAVAQWSRSANENTLNTQASTDQRSIGLQLTIPIYTGGGVDSSIRQTVAAKERAQQMLEASRRDLGIRVQREFRGITEGMQRVKALEQAVHSTEQSVQSSQKSFQGGSRTRIDILNAENNKMISMRDLAQARYAYLLAHLRLLALANEADSKAIDGINQFLKH